MVGRQPTLSDVVSAMFAPLPEQVTGVGFASMEEYLAKSRDAALALRGVCLSRVGPTVDGQTSADLDLAARMVHFDLSAAMNDHDVGVLMACVASWLQGRMAVSDGVKRILVLDEAWRVLEDPRIARWLRGSAKLARRGAGLSHWFLMHRFSDFAAAGDAGSEQVKHAQGLLSDSETRVIYQLNRADAVMVQETLGLTNRQTATIETMDAGTAMWFVGQRAFLVSHWLGSGIELEIVQNGLEVAA